MGGGGGGGGEGRVCPGRSGEERNNLLVALNLWDLDIMSMLIQLVNIRRNLMIQ